MVRIPNELSIKFNTVEGRKELIEKYGDRNGTFVGENEDGEEVHVSIRSENGIVCRTFQDNGWIFVSTYDKDGHRSDGYFDGRWKENS